MTTRLIRDADEAELELDVVRSFIIRPSYTTPRHTVEQGAKVLDHVHAEPLVVDIGFRITSNPLPDQAGEEGWDRVAYASDFLRETPFLDPPTLRIESDDPKIDELENMVIQSAPERSDMASGRSVDLTMTQARFGSVRQVATPDLSVTSRGKKKDGSNGTDDANDEDISWFRRLMNTAGITKGSGF